MLSLAGEVPGLRVTKGQKEREVVGCAAAAQKPAQRICLMIHFIWQKNIWL